MSLLKLAAPLAVLAFCLVPLATAEPPSEAGTFTITVGEVKGLIKEDNQMVIPYKGNATVDVSYSLDCSLIAYEAFNQKGVDEINHFHIHPVDGSPTWLVADEFRVDLPQPDTAAACANGSGKVTGTVPFPFGVSAAAPGVTTQVMNLTAEFANADVEADAVPVPFAVQFHADYDAVPSIQFPYTVTGKSVNFTVTATNRGNARSMIMFEELHASTGTFAGLGSIPYTPPQTQVFQVIFKAPDQCWTDATVDFKSFSHYLLLDQRAGSYKEPRDYSWQFHNGVACTPGKGNTTKASPAGGLAVLPVVLGAALLARRRVA